MTEYDYSPEGYERYIETQQRISRWVDTAEAHRHQFQAPFGVRSDARETEQWDGIVRKGRGRDDDRHSHSRSLSSQLYHSSPAPLPAPPPPMVTPPHHTWYPARGTTSMHQPEPTFVITTSSKRKSGKSSKSHRSHKSSSKSKHHTYIIQPPIPPPVTVAQPPPGQFGSPHTNSVTYITTDHNGYPVTRTSPLHPIPGSMYSYSNPPPPMTSPPPPMISPYTTPAGSPMLPPGSSVHHQPGNVVFVPPNTRTVRVMY